MQRRGAARAGRQSQTVFSDRYGLEQNGVDTQGDCMLLKFDYGSQTVGDEQPDFSFSACAANEQEEEVAK